MKKHRRSTRYLNNPYFSGTSILERVSALMESNVSMIVQEKIEEFKKAGNSSKEFIFGELSFCILTANTSAELGIRMQNEIGLEGFLNYDADTLRTELKRAKYRFYNVRSNFIAEARWIMDDLPGLLKSTDRIGARDYLVENVKGIGYKEASHFLRNVGIFDFAILDKHIMRMLSEEYSNLTLKTSTRKDYLKNEELIIDLACKASIEPGILDLYMWKIATGKIIK